MWKMKKLLFLSIGIFFGIVLVKAEVVSWFRIIEMFYFQSFHMYGIIGSAVIVGAITVLFIRIFKLKTVSGEEIDLTPKPFNKIGNYLGGTIFGLGWALTGACPGPLYALLGAGYFNVFIALFASLTGAYVYAVLRPKLPH
jgi:uncharacterized membrane protein YedE/YeeE